MGEKNRFFSGIGGLHLSIKNAADSINSKSDYFHSDIKIEVIKAFEINDCANITYKKNFPDTLICNKNIESLNLHDIPYADIWLLSPPCQPFTKGGSKKDSDDPRSKPFLKLIELMPLLESHDKLPKAWFVENVANFETSNTHKKMMNMLSKLNFCTFEFMLSPTLIGVPNTRVRYYCVSFRKDSDDSIKQLNELKKSIYEKNYQSIANNVLSSHPIRENIKNSQMQEIPTEYSNILCSLPYEYKQIIQMMNNIPSSINDIIMNSNKIDDESFKLLKQFANNIVKNNPSFKFDIVNINSKASTTFTKSYIETQGRGGPLFDYSENHQKSEKSIIDYDIYNHIFNTCTLEHQRFQNAQNKNNLRCFHPQEILLIMGFPDNWFENININIKKKYSLIGNSISVHIVTILLHFMLELLIN
ncbi:DNA methyltransferase [Cryptosporidium ubiquitum]|uniref:DNA methyltransferase n=1 Tax=Cryptosporidium ubiquitum TaxID=857276 RepID=A0A1J4MMU8_9CRYT|nr:DNA methyltransferase [Cryptosporidium ubiquitum]OII75375.1 DNA methyltransferase [Cryptosporidium ubiquitum]